MLNYIWFALMAIAVIVADRLDTGVCSFVSTLSKDRRTSVR